MATTTPAKQVRAKRTPIALHTRTIDSLTRAALTKKISVEELDLIATHITKLKSIFA